MGAGRKSSQQGTQCTGHLFGPFTETMGGRSWSFMYVQAPAVQSQSIVTPGRSIFSCHMENCYYCNVERAVDKFLGVFVHESDESFNTRLVEFTKMSALPSLFMSRASSSRVCQLGFYFCMMKENSECTPNV